MSTIHQLPPSVINKIAAGEVIERPASVVKELMENAVDAGATRVDVSIEAGGSQLVRVSDNGSGVSPDQLPLTVASHATSKIQTAEELFCVSTLGFRGEALASIAEVSHFAIRSRTHDADAGARLEVRGGTATELEPCGCPPGTVVEVRDLFFNTPVRRKFLKTAQTEMGHIGEAFTRIALAYPELHFTLRHNERTVHELPPVENWRSRIIELAGREFGSGLIWIEDSDPELSLTGYVADPQFSRSHNRLQYLFLNGRHIRDRALHHALSEAYRGLLLTGRFPIAFLQFKLPPESVDVNVHPTKLEVRFRDSGRIYSRLLGAIRHKFLASDLTAQVRPPQPAAADDAAPPTTAQPSSTGQAPAGEPLDRRAAVAWATSPSAEQAAGAASQGRLELPDPTPQSRTGITRTDGSWERDPQETGAAHPPAAPHPPAFPSRSETFAQAAGTGGAGTGGGPSVEPAGGGPLAPVPARGGMQIHDRYLVTESEEGMLVIDQHALHERILYEQLRDKVARGELEVQRLLIPETVNLAPQERAAALGARELLAELGLNIEPFGGDTVLVTSYPALLAKLRPADVLRHAVDYLIDGGKVPDRRDLADELLQMMSCKAAIKAGDRLTSEEISDLLEYRRLCRDAHHCPHGRPTALVFSQTELDRRFKRI